MMPQTRTPLGDVSEHLTLVRRMARATGVDLAAAMHDGDIDNQDWTQMVTNCRGCTCVDGCRATLEALEISDETSPAPDYCENRVTFDFLARQPA